MIKSLKLENDRVMSLSIVLEGEVVIVVCVSATQGGK